MGMDGNHGPDQRAKHQQDVDSGQIIILQAELERREGKIENKIKNKRQSDTNGDFSLPGKPKNFAK